MKILIDEQLPVKLKYRFSELGFDVSTVRDMNWLGLKNGHLMKIMVSHNFDVLITNDKNLYYQQKIDSLVVCVLNINSKTNRYEDVMLLKDSILQKLTQIDAYLQTRASGYFSI